MLKKNPGIISWNLSALIDERMVVKFRKGVKLCNIIKDRIIQKHFQESKLIIDFLLYNILCHDVICDIKKN